MRLLPIGLVLMCQAAMAWAQSPAPFTPAGNLNVPRSNHTATLLTTGKVLIAGGYYDLPAWASAELYDPSTATFVAAGDMTTPRCFHTATLLPDGKVLLAGGFSNFTEYNGRFSAILASAEI